jgi:hypothetical protein
MFGWMVVVEILFCLIGTGQTPYLIPSITFSPTPSFHYTAVADQRARESGHNFTLYIIVIESPGTRQF